MGRTVGMRYQNKNSINRQKCGNCGVLNLEEIIYFPSQIEEIIEIAHFDEVFLRIGYQNRWQLFEKQNEKLAFLYFFSVQHWFSGYCHNICDIDIYRMPHFQWESQQRVIVLAKTNKKVHVHI